MKDAGAFLAFFVLMCLIAAVSMIAPSLHIGH